MNYTKNASNAINDAKIAKDLLERIPSPVCELFKTAYYIDVHTHIFDILCINKSYFIIRMLKDILNLKSTSEYYINLSVEKAYNETSLFEEGWEEDLLRELEEGKTNFIDIRTKGIIDIFNARKFLGFKSMQDVYKYYSQNFTLLKDLKKENVLMVCLMMDLEIGWDTKLRKTIYQQVMELKNLCSKYPILPFLACDPRRANISYESCNLYSLFNTSFSGSNPFFGVKVYPALGFDPSDFRLWPIYERCEQYRIPIVTHCGGESISTDDLNIQIFEGDKEVMLKGKRRSEIAYSLNDPNRWRLVLDKFPKLILNFAHFGGYNTWRSASENEFCLQNRKEVIFEYMAKYDYVYADFSYNLIEFSLNKNLKEVLISNERIRNRTLFGTDYWVVNKEGDLLQDQLKFLNEMNDNIHHIDIGNLLTLQNPYRYLFGDAL